MAPLKYAKTGRRQATNNNESGYLPHRYNHDRYTPYRQLCRCNRSRDCRQQGPVDATFLFPCGLSLAGQKRGSGQDRQSTLEIAAAWLALGLDAEHAYFYRQSDVPEILELTWILTGMTAKGLMNRAHSYKAAVDANVEGGGKDPDKGITMALYSYPILMAADILMFKSTKVPVGQDQKQHVEMARDVAQRFNHHYGETFVLPEAVIGENTAVLKGLDGRKMSKSYNNTIPLFADEKRLRKLIMKIKTNSLEPGEPKDTQDSTLFDIYKAFATAGGNRGDRKALCRRHRLG